ncbi:ABC transporter substrate-binding protein [Streptomyces sp. RKAG293]|uniref:ABC transporter substrate-binding protein n=1 Tax=Streptomyces sp. RKAG293 TaxID=2893403 RepID=UPI0020346940|nr:ABC transporter substrate-binding protein [Streptomyces sp. RKAG293]MCM2417122.1 ABC transporter substrate-binding protein [Streptomyces sp. RKAG293]
MRDTLTRRTTRLAAVGATLVGALLVTACGGSDAKPAADSANAKITLTVNLFSDFGYKDLYAQYHQLHPNITIKENRADMGAHHQNLHAHLMAGSGTADIEAVEIGQIAGFQGQAGKFVNFLDHGVDRNQWVPSKTKPASSKDGTSLYGLGTDMGGMALCYRSDLFKKAGLPTDRGQVSALLTDWNAYFATGKQFLAKSPDKKAKWFDAGSNVFSAMTAQSPQGFYDDSGKVIADSNPAVKQAFDQVGAAVKDGESAGIAAFTPAWDTGFQKSQFATVTCPAWMSYEFKANPPVGGGTWDMARIPGGGGNWGGSYLTVPTQGKHTAAAVELAKWLSAPAQEAWLFKNKGYFPSDQALWSQPDIASFTDPLFNNAPTGKIFSESAKALNPQPLGAHGGDIGNVFGNGLVSVEQGKATPDKAWKNSLAEIANIGG